MENFFKKFVFGATVATGIAGTAEAQTPASPTHPVAVEQSVSPKTLWAKELVAKVDSQKDMRQMRDAEDPMAIVRGIETECINAIKSHIMREGKNYTPQDYMMLSLYYMQMNQVFKKWEDVFRAQNGREEGNPERELMRKELEFRAHGGQAPKESAGPTAVYQTEKPKEQEDIQQ